MAITSGRLSLWGRLVAGLLCGVPGLLVPAQLSAQAQNDASEAQGSADEISTDPLTAEQRSLISRLQSIEWQPGPVTGPVTGQIGSMAQIQVPEGYNFVGAAGAQTLLEAYGNPRDPDVLAVIVPASDDESWTLVFQFDGIDDYVKDEDKDSIGADAILAGFNAGLAPQNEQRRSMGAEEIRSVSWAERPFYDPDTKNLTWAMLAESATGNSINHDIRMLGRRGVMEATIVGAPETCQQAVPEVRRLLAGYSFTSGNTYAEWKPGDHIAELGLAGLIGGGAAAVAARTGLLGKLGVALATGGKAIIVGLFVLGAAAWSFIKRLTSFGEETTRQ